MSEYLERITSCLEKIEKDEQESLLKATYLVAETIKNGRMNK